MLFPGNFDDDLFTESRDRKKPALHSYNAKQCEPRWFENLSDTANDDACNIFRYQGNLAYNEERYAEAVVSFTKSKEALSSNNTTVFREVVEAICRCHIQLKNKTEASEAAEQLWEISSNFEQKTSALNLFVSLFQHFHCYEDALNHLIMLISLHPASPHLWMKLASSYICLTYKPNQNYTDISDLIHFISSKQTQTLDSPQVEVCTCLLKSRQLLKSVQHNLSSFAKQKNVADLNKIDVLVEGLSIPDEDLDQCWKKIRQLSYAIDTDDSEERLVPNVQILEVGKDVLRKEFESKWFTWNVPT